MTPIYESYESQDIDLNSIPADIPLDDQIIKDLDVVKPFAKSAKVFRDTENKFLYLSAEIPSPNQNKRPEEGIIDTLVMHYTACDLDRTIKLFLNIIDREKTNPVSAHYVVSEGGMVIQMVDTEERAWHAGVSKWRGKYGLNDNSIGIEIVNKGFTVDDADRITGWTDYTEQQKHTVPLLAKKLIAQYNIKDHCIAGHQDIAPCRKQDPGRMFFWDLLAEQGIGVTASHITIPENEDLIICQATNNEERGHGSDVSAMQSKLLEIGYTLQSPINRDDTQPESPSGVFDEGTVFAVNAFKSRFAQDRQIPDPRQGDQATWTTLDSLRADCIIARRAEEANIPLGSIIAS